MRKNWSSSQKLTFSCSWFSNHKQMNLSSYSHWILFSIFYFINLLTYSSNQSQ
jgi:hypothetical protein